MYFKMSSTEFFTQHAKRYPRNIHQSVDCTDTNCHLYVREPVVDTIFLYFLSLSMLGKTFSRRHSKTVFLFIPDTRFGISCKLSP